MIQSKDWINFDPVIGLDQCTSSGIQCYHVSKMKQYGWLIYSWIIYESVHDCDFHNNSTNAHFSYLTVSNILYILFSIILYKSQILWKAKWKQIWKVKTFVPRVGIVSQKIEIRIFLKSWNHKMYKMVGCPWCRMHQIKCFQMPIYIKLAPFLCHLSRTASTQWKALFIKS